MIVIWLMLAAPLWLLVVMLVVGLAVIGAVIADWLDPS